MRVTFSHATVLRDEVAGLLAPTPGRRVLDGTLGGGGHAEALLERQAHVIGLDRDPAALEAARGRLARFGDRFVAVHANFRDARQVLDSLHVDRVDGTLVDLGVSSPQLDQAARGFSFSGGGPLDMRMDTTRGQTLFERLQEAGEPELGRVIRDYGEEPKAYRIARAVKHALAEGKLTDTRALADVISAAIPRAQWPRTIHPATRTFQALRIWVNDEIGALQEWLETLPDIVGIGGRACAIAFHSLEDRPVKRRFAELSKGCVCPPDLPVCACGRTAGWRLLTRKAVVAGEAELQTNPRARSAHLRCMERVAA
jgi:16S rRNA (cytosine1402-N4)-methyltransferase